MLPHHRRSIRLKNYDYAQAGAYFVTICTYQRGCLFGTIENGIMQQNTYGAIVQHCWDALPDHFPQVELDAFVVMPNHLHGILVITDTFVNNNSSVGAQHVAPLLLKSRGVTPNNVKSGSLGAIVRSFKGAVTKQIHEITSIETPIWQRNYYEHIIRQQTACDQIRAYISTNPEYWVQDDLFFAD